MANDPQEKTLAQEAGLPDNWQPIDVAPIRPGQPAGNPSSSAPMTPYLAGSIPEVMQLGPDFVRNKYGTPGIPPYRLMPVSAAGNPAIVAAASSVVTQAISDLALVMPKQYKVTTGKQTVVTWVPENSSTFLAAPADVLVPGTFETAYLNSDIATTLVGAFTTYTITLIPPNWVANTSYSVGQRVTDTNGNVQRCTTAGTSGSSVPSWGTSVGSTTTDNSVTWTCCKYAISIGDTIFIAVESFGSYPTYPAITNVTDSSGNTFDPIGVTVYQTDYVSGPYSGYAGSLQGFYAVANANIASSGSYSIRLFGSGTSMSCNFTTFSNVGSIGSIIQAAGGYDFYTLFSTGTIPDVPAKAMVVSYSSEGVGAATIQSPFTSVIGGTGDVNWGFYVPTAAGNVSDSWSYGSSTHSTFASTMFYFSPLPTGGSITTSSGIPDFRLISNIDLRHAIFGASGLNHCAGAVPDPGLTPGTSRFLREDATWAMPGTSIEINGLQIVGSVPNFNKTTPSLPFGLGAASVVWQNDNSSPVTNISAYIPVFGASGTGHSTGVVPDPGSTSGTSRFLREDSSWASPSSSQANQSMQVDTVIFSDDYWIAVDTNAPGWAYPLTVM